MLATLRYRGLIEQLADEMGRSYGWKTQVASRLRISPAYLKKVREEERQVGIDAVERAVRAIGLSRDFFYDEGPPVLSYRDWLVTRSDPDPRPDPPGLKEFLASDIGKTIAPHELEFLRRVPFKGQPTAWSYTLLLKGLREEDS